MSGDLGRVAILGAGGFVGARLVEAWHLGGRAVPVPVVRRFAALARSSRFDLEWRRADARDEEALGAAFAGCDAVVHATVADAGEIAAAVAPVYRAAARAGVRRLVYLSSAAIHGLAPAAGTEETSPPPPPRHPYQRARVEAEARLAACRRRGPVETVVLRPGVVYGARSRWLTVPARELLEGRAWWVRGGRGVLNGLHVDNLVHAIERALAVPEADRGVFLVGDREVARWRDLLLPVAAAFGRGEGDFADVVPPVAPPLPPPRPALPGRALLGGVARVLVRGRLRVAVQGARHGWRHRPWSPPPLPREAPRATPDAERGELMAAEARPRLDRARDGLGFDPPVPFAAGVAGAVAWLGFAGWPVEAGPDPGGGAP